MAFGDRERDASSRENSPRLFPLLLPAKLQVDLQVQALNKIYGRCALDDRLL
jgi:hypothetical protein